jgi:hypothetical protein
MADPVAPTKPPPAPSPGTLFIDDMLPELLVFAPNAPDILCFRFIREAARKLCFDAKVWRQWTTVVIKPTNATAVVHALMSSPDSDYVEIEKARLNGKYLEPVTTDWLDAHNAGWDIGTELGSARYITQLQPNSIAIYPREPGTCVMRMVMQPSRNCLTLEKNLIDIYGTIIGRAAAAQLLMMPGVDFSNPSLGAALHTEFLGKIATLKTMAVKGQQGARLRTTGVWL